MEQLEVIASFDWLDKEETIGHLGYEKLGGTDVFSFEYTKEWLRNHPDIMLGKDLQLFTGRQYSPSGSGIFGCFADCLPDYWGRMLMDIKLRQSHYNNGTPYQRLSDWDYLKGVEDSLRIGGFRFRPPGTEAYLNTEEVYQVPPILSLNDLYEASQEIENKELDREIPDKRWIDRLFKPGSSVGGARPKACVCDETGLYIAKFPSTTDSINVGRWEYFANKMAERCGLYTTTTKLVSTCDRKDIFLSKRFDRTSDGKRIHLSSALNLLGLTLKSASEQKHGYSEIADFIVSNGTNVEKSLQELYRRVAFTICIGNADDHLKNHSFLLTKKGWELSPVYDINPSLFRSHSLLIDDISDESSLDRLFKAHKMYKIDDNTAFHIINEVTQNMKNWESTARDCGISDDEMKLFAQRFEDGMSWRRHL